MHRVRHLERRDDRTCRQQVQSQSPAAHIVDLLGIVGGELMENILGRPSRLVLPCHRLRARDLRHGNGCCAASTRRQQEFPAGRFRFFRSLGHGYYPPWVVRLRQAPACRPGTTNVGSDLLFQRCYNQFGRIGHISQVLFGALEREDFRADNPAGHTLGRTVAGPTPAQGPGFLAVSFVRPPAHN